MTDRITDVIQRLSAPAEPMPLETMNEQSIGDVIRQQAAMGEPSSKALDSRINLYANDQQQYNKAAEYLHNLPESIDPNNSFQVNTALARWARDYNPAATYAEAASRGKSLGEVQREQQEHISGMMAQEALAEKRKTSGTSAGGGVTGYTYTKLRAALENAGVQITPAVDLQLVSMARGGIKQGATININGQEIALGNIPGMEGVLQEQAFATSTGTQAGILDYAGPIQAAKEAATTAAIGPQERNKITAQEETKLEFEEPERRAAIEASNSSIKNTESVVQQAISLTSKETAGWSGLLSTLPAEKARTLSNAITTIKANLGFDKLQEMRNNSPTGGALGQVTELELDFLQSTVTKLDQLQRPEDLIKALSDIDASLKRLRQNQERAFGLKFGRIGASPISTEKKLSPVQEEMKRRGLLKQ